MGKYFGTDGIRGVVNDTLDVPLAYKTGGAAATVLKKTGVARPKVAIGKDTRISCDMLESALAAGLCSAGADVLLIGVLPTPAVAMLTTHMGCDLGIVISASHNPFEHNGIKIFNSHGFKLSDGLEAEVERLIDNDAEILKMRDGDIGAISHEYEGSAEKYIDKLVDAAEHKISGKILLDCANGAASFTAAEIFRRLGVDVTVVSNKPNGININVDCGSTHIENLQKLVPAGEYDIGFAFDGDAHRCFAVDERGSLIDGDQIMGVCARAMKASSKLKGGALVGTIASNSGMNVFAENEGLEFLTSDVGDRKVLELMQERGCNLGGETSGHTIFLDDATTGDGQLTAVKFMGYLCASGVKASELCACVPKFPQSQLSVTVTGGKEAKERIMADPRLAEAIAENGKILAGNGRVLIRPSGTEELIRVTVEAESMELSEKVANSLSELIKSL